MSGITYTRRGRIRAPPGSAPVLEHRHHPTIVGSLCRRTKPRPLSSVRLTSRHDCPWHPRLHALVEETKTAWEGVLGICRGGKGPQGRASGSERVTRRGEEALIKTSNVPHHRFTHWFVGINMQIHVCGRLTRPGVAVSAATRRPSTSNSPPAGHRPAIGARVCDPQHIEKTRESGAFCD